jgi:ABC-type nitrate/sulfonate/bicarbonate transport system substrate-binding protein
MNLITVTQDYLQKNPDTAERLLKAYIEGVAAMIHDKGLAAKIFTKYLILKCFQDETNYVRVVAWRDHDESTKHWWRKHGKS